MAKNPKQSEQAGKVKFRIIEFELEGSDASLHESLKNIATAFMRTPNQASVKAVRYDQRSVEESAIPVGDEVVEPDGSEEEQEAEAQSPRKAAQPRKAKPVAVKLLQEIRFDDLSPTLKEFCLEKSPKSELAKYLVIAYWFKNYRGIPDFTPDHFYTAYRFLNWSIPRDPGQPIRDLRHPRRAHLSGGQSVGTSTINHIGENIVNEMGAK